MKYYCEMNLAACYQVIPEEVDTVNRQKQRLSKIHLGILESKNALLQQWMHWG